MYTHSAHVNKLVYFSLVNLSLPHLTNRTQTGNLREVKKIFVSSPTVFMRSQTAPSPKTNGHTLSILIHCSAKGTTIRSLTISPNNAREKLPSHAYLRQDSDGLDENVQACFKQLN